jgi:thiol-disulfide isomerase/thioredoxin
MKKTFLIIAFLSVLLLTSSGLNDQRFGVTPGKLAPALALKNENLSVDLNDYRGSYVLLSFWSSSDANSRSLCNSYDAWVKNNDPLCEKVRLLAVNLDENSALFYNIVKADNLNENTQFNVKGKKAAKINSDYHLSAGYGTLLIGPDGRIIAANPSPALLTEHLQANV